MKKIISFCVYGTSSKYIDGAIRNLELQPEIYPDWTCRFYIDNRMPDSTLNRFDVDNVEVVLKKPADGHLGMFWRFEPLTDTTIERFIVRDTDSRLNVREASAVKDWEESGKEFHIMRDHEQHAAYICGGMWGATSAFINKIKDNYDSYKEQYLKSIPFNKIYGDRGRYFNTDQPFLWQYIWPKIINSHVAHIKDLPKLRMVGNEKIFAIENPDKSFVGEPFD